VRRGDAGLSIPPVVRGPISFERQAVTDFDRIDDPFDQNSEGLCMQEIYGSMTRRKGRTAEERTEAAM
jgi:hypothetical protein